MKHVLQVAGLAIVIALPAIAQPGPPPDAPRAQKEFAPPADKTARKHWKKAHRLEHKAMRHRMLARERMRETQGPRQFRGPHANWRQGPMMQHRQPGWQAPRGPRPDCPNFQDRQFRGPRMGPPMGRSLHLRGFCPRAM